MGRNDYTYLRHATVQGGARRGICWSLLPPGRRVTLTRSRRRSYAQAEARPVLRFKQNIGIYNLHMPTRGGGEKLSLVLAEHLSAHHNVRLFHCGELDVKSFEKL